jgi:hypothetical protein
MIATPRRHLDFDLCNSFLPAKAARMAQFSEFVTYAAVAHAPRHVA